MSRNLEDLAGGGVLLVLPKAYTRVSTYAGVVIASRLRVVVKDAFRRAISRSISVGIQR